MSPTDTALASTAPAGQDGAVGCARAASRDSRRKAILAIARDIFLEQGYAAASMSQVATRLGGSKGTLYNYFASKEELFAATVIEECEAEFADMAELRSGMPLEPALRRFGERFLRYVLSDVGLSFHRLLAAEAGRFPELGRMFYDAGPQRWLGVLAAYLQGQMDAGRLRQADAGDAAAFLLGLLKSNIHHKRVWNVIDPPTRRVTDAHVARAVEVFLHGFAILA